MLIRSYPGEDEVDQTETEGCDQSITLAGASLSEHCGTVESFKMLIHVHSNDIAMLTNDVDTTLLQVSAFSDTHHCSIGALTICWAIMTTKLASVARLTRGMVKSWAKRVK